MGLDRSIPSDGPVRGTSTSLISSLTDFLSLAFLAFSDLTRFSILIFCALDGIRQKHPKRRSSTRNFNFVDILFDGFLVFGLPCLFIGNEFMGITHSLRTNISRMTSSPQRAMKFIGSGFRHTKQAIYNTLCRLISAIAINKVPKHIFVECPTCTFGTAT